MNRLGHMAKRVWFVRHGESEANAGKLTYDPAVIYLTATGEDQAKAMAERFSDAPELIITSRYVRTQQTAQPLMEKYPHVPEIQCDVHEFTYLSPEKCRNTTIADRFPDVQRYWDKCDPNYCDGPGAESFSDFIGRVRTARKRLWKRRERFIVVFSHQQFISALLWLEEFGQAKLTSEHMRAYKRFLEANVISNCGIVKIDMKSEVLRKRGRDEQKTTIY